MSTAASPKRKSSMPLSTVIVPAVIQRVAAEVIVAAMSFKLPARQNVGLRRASDRSAGPAEHIAIANPMFGVLGNRDVAPASSNFSTATRPFMVNDPPIPRVKSPVDRVPLLKCSPFEIPRLACIDLEGAVLEPPAVIRRAPLLTSTDRHCGAANRSSRCHHCRRLSDGPPA